MKTTKTGKFIKKRRIEIGLNQINFAKKAKIGTPQQVCNFERGVCMPPIKRLSRIAFVLRVDKFVLRDLYLEDIRDELNHEL